MGFLRAGHTPTLVAALLYFDVSFMAWVLLGPLAPFLRAELGLTPTEQGLVTAIPLLGGSLFRPLLGMLGERIGGKRTGICGLTLTLLTLAAGWQLAHSTWHFYVLGFFLGIAGASFAVALPLASRWYPPEYQGLAMGIAGAGLATTLVQVAMFLAQLAVAVWGKPFRRFHILGRWWRADWRRLRQIFALGTPIAIAILLEAGVFVAAVVLMGWLGTIPLAAHQIAVQIASLTFMIPFGIAQAATVRVGHAVGRGDAQGVRRAGWVAIALANAAESGESRGLGGIERP